MEKLMSTRCLRRRVHTLGLGLAIAVGGVLVSAEPSSADPGDAPPEPAPLRITPAVAKESARLARSGQQIQPLSGSGGSTYWFTANWSSGDSRLVDYTTWTFYTINGSTTNFFVEAQGSAYTNWPYQLSRFEPWVMSGSSGAVLGNWDPGGVVYVSNGQTVTFSLAYQGAGVSTTFQANDQLYNPYVWSTHYSSEWQGSKSPGVSVSNRYETRWYNAEPWGMLMAACGRGQFWWGNCSDR